MDSGGRHWTRAGTICSLGVLVVTAACSDLAMEPDRRPGSLSIEPADTLIRQGEEAQLRVTVLDQDGEPFPSYPSWAPPEWSLSDAEAVTIAPNGQVQALEGGAVRVQAKLGGLTAWTNLSVNPLSVALSAPTIYLVQSIQNLSGDVPIVAGRDAFLRVFATGDRVAFYASQARATFFLGAEEIHTTTLVAFSDMIPDAVDESRIDRSFNAVIPGEVLQPGVEMVVELNVDGGVPLAPGSQVRIPAEGRAALDIRALPRMDLTVVPVLLEADPDPQIFAWTGSLDADRPSMRFARLVLPIGEMDLLVREPYTTAADLTTASGWNAFLREMRVLRLAEAPERYYYGTAVLPRGSEYGGLGYLGSPTSVGQPKIETLAHELGHNMSLRHAPCGGVSSFDPNFPHDGGSTGVWGYNFGGGSGLGGLVDPDQYKDLMGYCSPRWVSDYHFKKAMDFRLETEDPGAPAKEQPVLLVWGSVEEGELLLEPTFILDARPVLPQVSGPYRLEGFDTQGRRRFSIGFTPEEVSWGGGHFVFAIPVEPDWGESLGTITLTGPEGSLTVDGANRLGRMAMVTDGTTGRIQAILRDGATLSSPAPGTQVTYSEGLPARVPLRGRE